ncbi:carbohydrate ABC transporter permease [Paenibacillus rhizoplanae]
MLFSGGLIPSFILMTKLGLYDSFWVFIIPSMYTFFNMVIFMSFFRTIPDSLEESAKVDGASDYGVLFRIVLPNSMAVIATIALFSAVYHWNDYYQGVIYIHSQELLPLQTMLYKNHRRELHVLHAAAGDGPIRCPAARQFDQVRLDDGGHAADPYLLPLHSALSGQGRDDRRD